MFKIIICSFAEMAKYDIPAVLDFILKTVNQDQLFYIGHSMGCAQLFSGCSMKPELASKIKFMIAYAPAVNITEATTPFVKTVARVSPCTVCLYLNVFLHLIAIFCIFMREQ